MELSGKRGAFADIVLAIEGPESALLPETLDAISPAVLDRVRKLIEDALAVPFFDRATGPVEAAPSSQYAGVVRGEWPRGDQGPAANNGQGTSAATPLRSPETADVRGQARLDRARAAGRAAAAKLSGAAKTVPKTPHIAGLPRNRHYVVLRPTLGGRPGVYSSYAMMLPQVRKDGDNHFDPEAVFHAWPSLSEASSYAHAAGVELAGL
ncbi:MAG: hypothetical protein GY772_19350 [bacterium]|nr:hypothetical protein [bacterium]